MWIVAMATFMTVLGWPLESAWPTSATVANGPSNALRAVTNAATATSLLRATVALTLVPGHVFGATQPPIAARGAFDFLHTLGRVQLSEASGTETILFVPLALYVREPPSRGPTSLPAGKTWIAAGLTETPGIGSSIPQFVDQVEAVNASFVLEEVARGAVQATSLTASQIDGQSAQRYAVTVDLRRASSRAGGPGAVAFSRAVNDQVASLVPGGTGAARIKVRVWVAPSGLVVRVQSSPPGSGVGEITETYSRFGSPVRVAAPPAAQIVDIATLNAAGEQENGLGDVA